MKARLFDVITTFWEPLFEVSHTTRFRVRLLETEGRPARVKLAEADGAPADSKFFRKGTPDAGVECFWQLPNSDAWAWQAKFFLSMPTARQWSDVDRSVRTAIAKHPRSTRYTVCFPLDFADARRKGQKSAMDRWHERVAKWQEWAKAKKRSMEFEFWGEHAISGWLAEERHRGRYWFWFSRERFSLEWFKARFEAFAV